MRPALSRAESCIAELLGSNGQADCRVVVGVEGRDTDTDART